jgi:hypothetical protein
MLEVETNHQIILMFFREGLSIRKIARKLKIHRSTVKARIDQYEQFKASPLSDQDKPRSLLNQYLKTGLVYNSASRCKRKLTEDIIAIIDGCLQENEAKRLDGRMKQRLKKIDIHEKILSAGHVISYCVVCDHIRTKTAQTLEAFIRQGYAEGSSCEFDWGEIRIRVGGGKRRRYYLAVFTSAFSNYRFAIIFERQDSLAFKEAHICFFEYIGGVYQQIVYDNMRVAVAQFVGRNEKTPTEGLLQLSRWYQYQWRFCNAAKGNEKGHVERSVEFVRRKVFGFKDEFESLPEAQVYLLERLGELNNRSGTESESAAVKLDKERKGLCAHPGRMECFAGENHKVDKYSTICYGTNRYSVPDHLIGKMVFAKIYSHQIKIYDTDKVLCQHQRLYERFSWQINLDHYLVTLQRKPGAVAGSIALKQAPLWLQTMFRNHFTHDSRSFIELLQYCQFNGISNDQLQVSVEKLSHRFSADITADHVIALLGNRMEEVPLSCNGPDAIALRSMENLKELASMMNFN